MFGISFLLITTVNFVGSFLILVFGIGERGSAGRLTLLRKRGRNFPVPSPFEKVKTKTGKEFESYFAPKLVRQVRRLKGAFSSGESRGDLSLLAVAFFFSHQLSALSLGLSQELPSLQQSS